jgi:hypothetical protein
MTPGRIAWSLPKEQPPYQHLPSHRTLFRTHCRTQQQRRTLTAFSLSLAAFQWPHLWRRSHEPRVQHERACNDRGPAVLQRQLKASRKPRPLAPHAATSCTRAQLSPGPARRGTSQSVQSRRLSCQASCAAYRPQWSVRGPRLRTAILRMVRRPSHACAQRPIARKTENRVMTGSWVCDA